MCNWGDSVTLWVPTPAELSYNGKFRWDLKNIDRCIASIVDALNISGVYTSQSCCGHGKGNGIITLHDGRKLVILSPNMDPTKDSQ